MIKLVLSDMDGTLVPFGRPSVSGRVLAAIDALRDVGIRFGLASGREWHDATSYFGGEERYLDTCIGAAGKQVRLDGETIFTKPFSNEVLRRMADACRRRGDCALVVFSTGVEPSDPDKMCFCVLGAAPWRIEEYQKTRDMIPDAYLIDELPDQQMYTVGMVAFGEPTEWETIREEMEAEFPEVTLVCSAEGFYDVNPGGWTKADALPILLDACKLSTDEVIYLGDSDNDVAVMGLLPHTVAVAGATETCAATASIHIGAAEDDAPAALMAALATHGGDLRAALAALG